MRVFALSDVHLDYDVNAQWVERLSLSDYRDDVLILAGDLSDSLALVESGLRAFARRFKQVLFVPGNHDLWVARDDAALGSLQKFEALRTITRDCGVAMHTLHWGGLQIVPLLGWYDYSFGPPGRDLLGLWSDFRACRWPERFDAERIASHFLSLNDLQRLSTTHTLISFSHFLPRIDVMPERIPEQHRFIYPVLGTHRLDAQVRALGSVLHVYGHSHVNRDVVIDGVRYVNNAFAYPKETRIARKELVCVHEVAST